MVDECNLDPWKDCERIFDDHFMDRMKERSLPSPLIDEALKFGKKIPEKNDVYKIKWNRWTLVVFHASCLLYLQTAYLD